MYLKPALCVLALLTALAEAETRVSFYTAKDCSSGHITTATGDGSHIGSPGVTFALNTYVGSIAIDHFDRFSAQLNDQDGCCQYAPTCKVPAPVSNGDGFCVEHDKYLSAGSVGFTVWDSLCIDNDC
ncbi:hypothetical protein LTR86_009975 [Recurvomyces mirabilis]|nr:hypothetical protein LTR86_009975 [Recurvomyces mirabilis]